MNKNKIKITSPKKFKSLFMVTGALWIVGWFLFAWVPRYSNLGLLLVVLGFVVGVVILSLDGQIDFKKVFNYKK